MTTITIDDELLQRFRATAVGEEDFGAFMADAARAKLEQRERRWQAARAEAQAILNGPRHTLEESTARIRQKYNHPDLSHLTSEQIAEEAEAILNSLPPEKIAEAERLGLL